MTANNNVKNHNIDIYIYRLEISSENCPNSITYLGQTLSLTQRLHNHISGNGKSSMIIHSLIQSKSDICNSPFKVKRILNLYKITVTNDKLYEVIQNECNSKNSSDNIDEIKNYRSLIDSIRTNFENIIYDLLRKKKNDFNNEYDLGAYNITNFFDQQKKETPSDECFNCLKSWYDSDKRKKKRSVKNIIDKLNNSNILKNKLNPSIQKNIIENGQTNKSTFEILKKICDSLSNEEITFSCKCLEHNKKIEIDERLKEYIDSINKKNIKDSKESMKNMIQLEPHIDELVTEKGNDYLMIKDY
ncbi:hypothetical protein HW41_05470 [Apilactobacillus kunkeei]|uniref:hypothetical protein n=1 Tax=Apilactobacillus kunkeei TaxID=148814 RepID=UPI00059ABF72|nr:hypothetical protein [Apilactobacillus kunkeei]KIM18438.1 hypothetical protein HW41_05470 [Apilactobacillus kunkeei]MBX8455928.1 hypothetical protein [Apilactobacillus kunkeei]QYU54111.1 hypothetical protein K2W87_05585 [Apilactobacillus kunkeei]CAI2629839.1 hypothetical protein AKUH3B202M_11290 [Apilactobacillus kunkeei]CAI2632405.1 hypothetical protein AKUH2B105J_11270 [Apilactobacillus kunkeei]